MEPAADPHPCFSGALLGREAELATLAGWWQARVRLAVVTGPGGIGKSHLASEAAARAPWPHLSVPLDAAAGTQDLVAAVAAAVRIPSDDAADDQGARLRLALGAMRKTVVILDNFEQLPREAALLVAEWATAAPQLRWLVTSRRPLGLAGERVLALRPLPSEVGAALLERQARRLGATPDADFDDDARQRARRIADAVEGLPLALELAASRLSVMGLDELERRLTRRVADLADPSSARPPRQRSLAGAFDWSWELLEPWTRAALTQATVLAGSFGSQVFEAVVTTGEARWGALDALQQLVAWGLVRRVEDAGRRFTLPRNVAEAAALRAEAAQLRAARQRHAEALVAVAERGPDALEVEDVPGLRAALDRALAGEVEVGPGAVAQLALGLEAHLSRRGRFRLAARYLDGARARAGALDVGTRVALLRAVARVRASSFRIEAALEAADEAVAVADEAGDLVALAEACFERSRVFWVDHDYGAGSALELRTLARLEDAPRQVRSHEATFRLRLGHAMTRSLLGRREESYPQIARILALTRGADDPRLVGLHEIAGVTAWQLGCPTLALRHYEDGAASAARVGDLATLAWLQVFSAALRATLGDATEALARMDEQVEKLGRHGRTWHHGHALQIDAELRLRAGDPEGALARLAVADEAATRQGLPKLRSLVSQTRAVVALSTGEGDAPSLAREAEAALGRRDDPEGRAWTRLVQAWALARADPEAAAHAAEGAKGDLEGVGESTAQRALALVEGMVRPERAQEALTGALSARSVGGGARLADVWRQGLLWMMTRSLEAGLSGPARWEAWRAALDPSGEALVVAADGTQVQPPGGALADLSHRPQVAAVLACLAREGGAGVSAILAGAWPGERMQRDAGRNRVYAALSALRKLGLDPWIGRKDGAYRLEAPRIVRVPASLSEWRRDISDP